MRPLDEGLKNNLDALQEGQLAVVAALMLELAHTLFDFFQDAACALCQNHIVVGAAGTERHVHDVIEHPGLDIGTGINVVQLLVVYVGRVADGAPLPLIVHAHHEFFGLVRNDDFTQRADFGHVHLVLDPVAAPFGVRIKATTDAGQRADNGVFIKEKFFGQQKALQKFGAEQNGLFPRILFIHGLKDAQTFGVHLLIGIGHDSFAEADTIISRRPVDGVGSVSGFFRCKGGFRFFWSKHGNLLVIRWIEMGGKLLFCRAADRWLPTIHLPGCTEGRQCSL